MTLIKSKAFWIVIGFALWTLGVWHYAITAGDDRTTAHYEVILKQFAEQEAQARRNELSRLNRLHEQHIAEIRAATARERARRAALEGYVDEILSTPAPDCSELPDVWVSRAVEALNGHTADGLSGPGGSAGETGALPAGP